MDTILYYICIPFGVLMKWCWQLVSDYGVAIILFTLVTKLVLIPVSVWIHKNSILMVKIQPDINFIKAKYFGDADMIADEQAKLFKKHKLELVINSQVEKISSSFLTEYTEKAVKYEKRYDSLFKA